MKLLKLGFLTTLLCLATEIGNATVLDMYGSCSYSISGSTYYFAGGRGQSGRRTNLGAGRYRTGSMYVGYLDNLNSSGYSGSMSLEFWAMPYYGASTGFIKMTRVVGRLPAQYYYYDLYRSGWMKNYGNYRYPEFNLYEYTAAGWRWRDDVKFSNSAAL